MILTVGATGHLGGAIVEELCRRGKPVRCLVRKGSDIAKLPAADVEIAYGAMCATVRLLKRQSKGCAQ